MDAESSPLQVSLRPLLNFLSLIGIELKPIEGRSRCARWRLFCYGILCFVANIISNMYILIHVFDIDIKEGMSILALRHLLMNTTFTLQVVGSHLSLGYFCYAYWVPLRESLLTIEALITPDDHFYRRIRRFSFLAVALVLSEIIFSAYIIWQEIHFQNKLDYKLTNIFSFYMQMYSSAAVALLSILVHVLNLNYGFVKHQVVAVGQKLKIGSQSNGWILDLSRQIHNWEKVLLLLDDCNVQMNRAFVPVLLIQVSCLFLRFLSAALPTWDVLESGRDTFSLIYSVPTMIKYLTHLWAICYTVDAVTNERQGIVRSLQNLPFPATDQQQLQVNELIIQLDMILPRWTCVRVSLDKQLCLKMVALTIKYVVFYEQLKRSTSIP